MIEELNVTIGGDSVSAGIFVLRCYGLWGFGSLSILVDGAEYTTIVFSYTVGAPVLIALVFLPILLYIAAVLLARRCEVRKH